MYPSLSIRTFSSILHDILRVIPDVCCPGLGVKILSWKQNPNFLGVVEQAFEHHWRTPQMWICSPSRQQAAHDTFWMGTGSRRRSWEPCDNAVHRPPLGAQLSASSYLQSHRFKTVLNIKQGIRESARELGTCSVMTKNRRESHSFPTGTRLSHVGRLCPHVPSSASLWILGSQ